MSPVISIGLAGSGGDGVILLGELLARCAARLGQHCFLSKSFGPQIRGGESSCRLSIAAQQLHCPGDQLDLLGVLSWDGLAAFQTELRCAPDCPVLCDARDPVDSALLSALGTGQAALPLPLDELAQGVAGSKLARNMVLAGAVLRWLGWPRELFAEQLAARLGQHGSAELAGNGLALTAGYGLDITLRPPATTSAQPPLELLTGNQAIVRGALAAGCRFFAGYPISPATEIMEELIAALPQLGGTGLQAEDEIAAIGMALGAAWGGRLAMTATSGPGLSLQAESLGLAVMSELPLVLVDVQRCGPSTGIPTRTEQGDLNIALYGRHGDAPLPLLAPVDIADCTTLSTLAFAIAAERRSPVLLLSDQYLAQGLGTLTAGLGWPAAPGLSAAAQPAIAAPSGQLTGLAHDSAGLPSSDPVLHQANCARRAAKIAALLDSPLAPPPARYTPEGISPDSASLGILTWGSSFGPCCAAADLLAAEGISVSVLAPRLLFPLGLDDLGGWLAGCTALLVAELNQSGQFFHYLRSQLELPAGTLCCSRAGGSPLARAEIAAAMRALLAAKAAC